MGGPKQRDHFLRQHRVRDADSLPVRHHGGMGQHSLLGESINSYQEDNLLLSRVIRVEIIIDPVTFVYMLWHVATLE